MTEAEIIKLVFSHLPTLAIVIGIAKIYLKINQFVDRTEKRIQANREDIETLIRRHLEYHNEDALKFRRRNDE